MEQQYSKTVDGLDREIGNRRIMNHTTLANYSLSSRRNLHQIISIKLSNK